MCTTNSVISPTPTAARALCGSSAISWIELVRSTLLALASSADFLPSCHSAIRDPIAYPALRFRASTLLSRENVSPLRKFVSRSRAKMDQALPPLFVRAGQRSYVDYCAEGGRSLGTRLDETWHWSKPVTLGDFIHNIYRRVRVYSCMFALRELWFNDLFMYMSTHV